MPSTDAIGNPAAAVPAASSPHSAAAAHSAATPPPPAAAAATKGAPAMPLPNINALSIQEKEQYASGANAASPSVAAAVLPASLVAAQSAPSAAVAEKSAENASNSPAAALPTPAPAPSAAPSAAPSISPDTLLNGGYKRPGFENGPDGYYDEVEIEDMEYDEDTETFTYPCPCGDKFVITKDDLLDGEDIARCPSCSLLIKVIYDPEDLEEED